MTTSRTYLFELTVSDNQLEELASLADTPAIGNSPAETRAKPKAARAKVLEYLIARVCDGVRRPGSWERGLIQEVFGYCSPFYVSGSREIADESREKRNEGRAQ